MVMSFSALAESDRYQAEIAYQTMNEDDGDGDDVYSGLSGSYYFEPITLDDGPMAEAAYLQRVGSLGFTYVLFDAKGDMLTFEGDGQALLYTHMQKDSPYRVQVLYGTQQMDVNFLDLRLANVDMTLSGVSIGYFISRTVNISLDILRTDVMVTNDRFDLFNDYHTTETTLAGKNLIQNGDGTAWNIVGELMQYKDSDGGEKNTGLNLEMDYYFNQRQSAGAVIGTESGDIEYREGKTIGIRGKIFLLPQFWLSAEFTKFYASGVDTNDSDTLSFSSAYRF